MYEGKTISLVIPALNEEGAVGSVIAGIDREIADEVIVVDNGSTDDTAAVAADRGATVVREDHKGYGSACLAGLREARGDVIGFLDGDGSDDPADLEKLLAVMEGEGADLVIGSRMAGRWEPGSLTLAQQVGNRLACLLVRILWGVRYSDLGPFRIVTREALDRLGMSDEDFGFTIEMQVKAARLRLHTEEVPVSYRCRRAGRSKISGDLVGSFMAGKKILGYVARARAEQFRETLSER